MFDHVAHMCGTMNPKYLSSYTEESMMKTGTRVYSSMAAGPYEETIQSKFLGRYTVALELEWSGLGK
jgi:hypothetical protein